MPPKLRALCLHSFRMNAGFFKWQVGTHSNLGRILVEEMELVFLDGAHRCSAEAEQAMPMVLRKLCADAPPPCYEWWNRHTADDGDIVYGGYSETLAYIDAFVRREGPFDGVLGFSQGGILAHLLCMLDRHGRAEGGPGAGLADGGGLPQPDPLQFVILISPRTTRATATEQLLRDATQRPLALPSLVMYGGADTEVPPESTRELLTTLDRAALSEVYLPGGSHKVPVLGEADEATCRNFMSRVREIS